MGGKVGVRSQLGRGSVFSLDLSLSVADATPVLPDLNFEGRVLVVDDNASANDRLCTLLRAFALRVESAAGSDAMLERIAAAERENDPFAAIFLDWKMPGIGGEALASVLHRRTWVGAPAAVVLMISGAQELPDQIDRAHVDMMLSKPAMPSEVADVVARLFDPDHAHKTETVAAHADRDCLVGRAILLVEDNPINQEVVQGLLEMIGARVTIACDGRQALQFLDRQSFDIVLMDVHLPVMDGFEATEEIRKAAVPANLPIIALTANALEGDRERCLAAGMNDYTLADRSGRHVSDPDSTSAGGCSDR